MPWIMAIHNSKDDDGRIRGMGPVLRDLRVVDDGGPGDGEVQAAPEAARPHPFGATEAPVYNRDEDGIELKCPHKGSGGRKLSDDAVAHCRTVIGSRTIKELAQEHGVSYYTMWNAVKGYTYRHLNFRFPPRFR